MRESRHATPSLGGPPVELATTQTQALPAALKPKFAAPTPAARNDIVETTATGGWLACICVGCVS